MANIQRLSVELTPELVWVVQEALDTGDYISESEVVRDALRTWKVSRSLQLADTVELARVWQEGLDSGEPVEAQPVFDRLKAKYAPYRGDRSRISETFVILRTRTGWSHHTCERI